MEINIVSWDDAQTALRLIRQKVFVEEQQVPEDLEWDHLDKQAIHFLGKEGNRPVACARLLKDGRLGRLAVLKDYRTHGWGGRILRAAEEHLLDKKKSKMFLSSQANSYYFYFKNGYRPTEEMSWDAGIPHIQMQKILKRPNPTSKTYILGADDESHISNLAVASSVWFQIGSSQCSREINIQINDLTHPLFNNAACISNLTSFIKKSRQTQLRVLINKETPGLSEHPLLQLQHRMSSRFKIRAIDMFNNKEVYSNQVLFDLSGYLRFDYQTTHCNFSNRYSVRRHRTEFEKLWTDSKELIEGKKLNM
ncbi:GCN5-related N-acetyltransferase [Oleispira antarctica RB-8]|uniref:GCN5-related N-acetyltransferase n=1 Tax=Oleispira antarctica RB-8 TaxID=698738 RepID=R4YMH0_OLEAN|nr:GCN5-related N-acetyltransferase [Oleispira antarctica RB-8]